MRTRARLVVAVTVLCGCGRRDLDALSGEAGMSAAERASLAGSLAWVSERGGHREVLVAPAAGGTPRRLAALPDGDMYAGPVSPDGRAIALVSARGDRQEDHEEALWLLDLRPGARPRALLASSRVRNPAFAGGALLVEADLESYSDLYRVSLTGGPPLRITRDGDSFQPSPAPGGAIAFTSSKDGIAQIYRMDAGAEPRRLTASGAEDLAPLVAPTGEWILFTSARDGRDRLYLMRPDGGDLRPLNPPVQGEELAPAWSPDGTRVAFLVRSERDTRLWITDLAAGTRRPLSAAGQRDDQPVFSPDGRHVAFASERGGNPDIYVARADGGAVARITEDPAADWLPRWLPAGGATRVARRSPAR
jgi:Tol biopolymer transport system component